MSNFKRVSLAGSEELFRPTRPKLVEADDALTEIIERPPAPEDKLYRQLNLTPEEVTLLLDAIQSARFPDRAAKPSLDRFERLAELRNKLQE